MKKKIAKVLNKIENSGFEAYLVGGYVRDLLVGKTSYDIDICTNATPKELLPLFPNASSKNLGGIDFKEDECHFEITTYRKEIKYKDRKPVEYVYVDSLEEDIVRRDFTVNAICMNSKGEFIDLVGGIPDLQNNKIKMIGDIPTKIKEDPLRILRGIRITTLLNFNLDKETYKNFLKNNKEVLKLSNTIIKEEFDKILLSQNVRKGLSLLNDLGILKLLKINYPEEIIPVKSIEGMYSQLDYHYDFPFTKEEKNNIISLKEILSKGEIDNEVLYYKGLYLSLIAGEILNIDKLIISKMHKELPIHHKKDIIINAQDIVDNLKVPYSKVGKIMDSIELLLLNNKIVNDKSIIIKYISDHKSEWI